MALFQINHRFYPLRLNAFVRNEVELTIELENEANDIIWSECDIIVPEAVSLAPDRELTKGRVRVGIMRPREVLTKKCKIYGSARSYPEVYPVRIIAYGFGNDGSIVGREEKRIDLRCERLGNE
ncbi:Uncharacterised protein [Candidatus Gugararchaeum adminiculabundum]|nr:Uncharacterised protein [Candidatus Gugararchaeum adminiculabundum]